jgi:hypothetical protein
MTTALVHTGTPPGTALAAPAPARISMLRPIAAPAEVLQAQEETRNMVQQALQEGRDFGKIPGIEKASLLKPGAERVALAASIATCFSGRPFFHMAGGARALARPLSLCRRVPVIHRESGEVVGSCIGSCSTMESKYIDRPRDCENTALKMAHKRALVGATLITFGLSDRISSRRTSRITERRSATRRRRTTSAGVARAMA